jgi:DNA-binding response OmpR family regulator
MQTILLIDDEPAVRVFLELVLQHAGFSVVRAACECEAISISHGGEISLQITPITLPEDNGWRVAEELLAAEPVIPVLCVSGGGSDSDQPPRAGPRLQAETLSLEILLTEVRHLLTENDPCDVS